MSDTHHIPYCELEKRAGTTFAVYWRDPDEGACSRYYTVQTIKLSDIPAEIDGSDATAQIVSVEGDILECPVRELFWGPKKTRSVEIARAWNEGDGEGTWDTETYEIPLDTPEEQVEQVALKIAQDLIAGGSAREMLAHLWVYHIEGAEEEDEQEEGG